MGKIIVLGAGVAGSTTALLIASRLRGPPITVYDASNTYLKPCGEAVPVELLDTISSYGLPQPRIVEFVKCFRMGVLGKQEKTVEFEDYVWAIIDKGSWVNRLRKEMEGEGVIGSYGISLPRNPPIRGDGVVIDARGPFSSRGLKIPVWRTYAPRSLLKKSGCEGAHIYFTLRPHVGLAWIFPYGNRVNLGGGFIGSRHPRRDGLALLSHMVSVEELRALADKGSHALLTILPKPRLWDGRRVYVGEAAGLVLSLGGEGIRPAILSAIALAESFRGGGIALEQYNRRLKGLLDTVRVQALLLKVAAMIGSEEVLGKLIHSANDNLLRKWLSGRLGPREAVEVLRLVTAAMPS